MNMWSKIDEYFHAYECNKNNEDALELLIQLSVEDCPSILKKHFSGLAVSKSVSNRYKITSYAAPERRQEPMTEAKKTFSTFLSLPQDFRIVMMIKNLGEREQYIIMWECTSRFFEILRDLWNELRIVDKDIYLISEDLAANSRILWEVLCRDVRYTR